ncbi:hypothetical protein PR048_023841 [Dryococelus australis]|uniref:Uncharacterized protein n=1 Tax=Dryococelus australis TaxID=614101 RepID=A0ABQ9GVA4_9NEOP|nr:hypothetical protein PR048_023841 [Dryococelus australis]
MKQHRNARVGRQEIPEKTRRHAASPGTIPTCENPGVTRLGIEPSPPWWEASSLTAQPQRPLAPSKVGNDGVELARRLAGQELGGDLACEGQQLTLRQLHLEDGREARRPPE